MQQVNHFFQMYDFHEIGLGGQLLWMGCVIGFPLAVWIMSILVSNSPGRNTRLLCGAGLYLCYVLAACTLFIVVAPYYSSKLVQNGMIVAADAAMYTAIMISIGFGAFNLLILGAAVMWHIKKSRKEMTELDRMKLEDI